MKRPRSYIWVTLTPMMFILPGMWPTGISDIHMAFPPYWFFTTKQGLGILGNRIKPGHSVGVHVPVSISKDPKGRPQELRNVDLFIEPGEIRDVLPVTLRVEEN